MIDNLEQENDNYRDIWQSGKTDTGMQLPSKATHASFARKAPIHSYRYSKQSIPPRPSERRGG